MKSVPQAHLAAQVVQAFQTVLCEAPEQLERSTGLLTRKRKITGATLAQTLVLGWQRNPAAGMGELAQQAGEVGLQVSATALEKRMTRRTANFLLALWEVAAGDHTQFRERYRRYMALEAEAVSLWHFAVSVLPGLLQTAGYAREVFAAGELTDVELEQQVDARMSRRELLEGSAAPQFRTILSEGVLRMPLRNVSEWRAQLEYLAEVSERRAVTVQVLPFAAGPHGLVGADVMFLRLPDGRPVAYVEHAVRGELVEEYAAVERLQRAYDAVRDMALPPAESRKFILQMLEEVPCDPST